MKTKELLDLLEKDGIENIVFDGIAQRCHRKSLKDTPHSTPKKYLDYKFDITQEQYKGVLTMCEPYRPFFDQTEYSKLVCKKLADFSKHQSAALHSYCSLKSLNISSYATPCKPLPSYLITICNSAGIVKIQKGSNTILTPITAQNLAN